MSGVKCSRIELEREQKARQDALRAIESANGVSSGLQQQAFGLIAALPDGVRTTFSADVDRARRLVSASLPSYRNDQTSAELTQVMQQIEKICHQQRQALQILTDVRESKRGAKERELLASLEEMKGELNGHRELLDKWRPTVHATEMAALNTLSGRIAAGDFVSVASELGSARQRTFVVYAEVAKVEAQDKERHFVLGALREVVQEMGWKEITAPTLADPKNPASAIIYEADTYYAGEIQFALGLDGIRSHSDISNDARGCYREFGNISEKLKAFGIKTEFTKVDGEEDLPELRARGEIEEPDGASMQLCMK